MALTYSSKGAGTYLPLPPHAPRFVPSALAVGTGQQLLYIPLLSLGSGQTLPLPAHAPKGQPPALHLLQYVTMSSNYKVEDGQDTGTGYEGPRIYPPPYALRPG